MLITTGHLAGTWGLYNVGSTSMQRHDVASTLRRRCINVMCPLGSLSYKFALQATRTCRIVRNNVKHLENHDILNKCQQGFRVKRSCETQIIPLFHELASSLDSTIQTDMLILDFSRALDLVPHQRLLNKVHHYGIRGCTLKWIASFLNSITQQVIVEGQSSEKVQVVSGVR